jgi:hypothetical protein
MPAAGQFGSGGEAAEQLCAFSASSSAAMRRDTVAWLRPRRRRSTENLACARNREKHADVVPVHQTLPRSG